MKSYEYLSKVTLTIFFFLSLHSPEHQRQLVDSVKNIVREVDAADAVEMLALLNGNMLLKAKIAEEMTRFAAHQMNLQIGQ